MPYPDDWDTRRRQVYKRDDYTCRNCGQTGGDKGETELHAHHIVPKSRGGSHSLSNLATLCKECHRDAHGKKTVPWHESNQTYWKWFKKRYGLAGIFFVVLLWPVMVPYIWYKSINKK
jgi:5-methylcytosine-specific restriction endonuclease McrA